MAIDLAGRVSFITAPADGFEQRIIALFVAPEEELDYGRVASITRTVDEIVVSEIEHWQDVVAGKHISVPV